MTIADDMLRQPPRPEVAKGRMVNMGDPYLPVPANGQTAQALNNLPPEMRDPAQLELVLGNFGVAPQLTEQAGLTAFNILGTAAAQNKYPDEEPIQSLDEALSLVNAPPGGTDAAAPFDVERYKRNERRRVMAADMLELLSVGLGQISAGQAVNLGPSLRAQRERLDAMQIGLTGGTAGTGGISGGYSDLLIPGNENALREFMVANNADHLLPLVDAGRGGKMQALEATINYITTAPEQARRAAFRTRVADYARENFGDEAAEMVLLDDELAQVTATAMIEDRIGLSDNPNSGWSPRMNASLAAQYEAIEQDGVADLLVNGNEDTYKEFMARLPEFQQQHQDNQRRLTILDDPEALQADALSSGLTASQVARYRLPDGSFDPEILGAIEEREAERRAEKAEALAAQREAEAAALLAEEEAAALLAPDAIQTNAAILSSHPNPNLIADLVTRAEQGSATAAQRLADFAETYGGEFSEQSAATLGTASAEEQVADANLPDIPTMLAMRDGLRGSPAQVQADRIFTEYTNPNVGATRKAELAAQLESLSNDPAAAATERALVGGVDQQLETMAEGQVPDQATLDAQLASALTTDQAELAQRHYDSALAGNAEAARQLGNIADSATSSMTAAARLTSDQERELGVIEDALVQTSLENYDNAVEQAGNSRQLVFAVQDVKGQISDPAYDGNTGALTPLRTTGRSIFQELGAQSIAEAFASDSEQAVSRVLEATLGGNFGAFYTPGIGPLSDRETQMLKNALPLATDSKYTQALAIQMLERAAARNELVLQARADVLREAHSAIGNEDGDVIDAVSEEKVIARYEELLEAQAESAATTAIPEFDFTLANSNRDAYNSQLDTVIGRSQDVFMVTLPTGEQKMMFAHEIADFAENERQPQ